MWPCSIGLLRPSCQSLYESKHPCSPRGWPDIGNKSTTRYKALDAYVFEQYVVVANRLRTDDVGGVRATWNDILFRGLVVPREAPCGVRGAGRQRIGGLKRKNIGGSRTDMLRRRAFQVRVTTLPPDPARCITGHGIGLRRTDKCLLLDSPRGANRATNGPAQIAAGAM
jgi:hypothetical protein